MSDFKPLEFSFTTIAQLDQLIKWARAQRRLVYGEITITPATATILLRPEIRDPEIRPLSQADTDSYIRDLLANAWDFNGDALMFGKNGLLFNGQKRLTACAQSGKSFKTLLVFNSFPVNANRGQRQGLNNMVVGPQKNFRTALGRLFLIDGMPGISVFSSYNTYKPTPRETGTIQLARGEDMLRFSQLITKLVKGRMSKLVHYGWLADHLEKKTDFEFVEEFFTDLADGAERGSPIARLRNRLQADKAGGTITKALSEAEATFLVAKVYRAWYRGEDMEKLQLPRGNVRITQEMILAVVSTI